MQSSAALTAQASASNPIRYASCSRASHQPVCIVLSAGPSAELKCSASAKIRPISDHTTQRPAHAYAHHADPGKHPTAEMHAKRGGPLLQRSSVGTAERVGSEQPILEAQVYRRRPVGRRRPRRVALREVGEERMRKRLHRRAPKSRRSMHRSIGAWLESSVRVRSCGGQACRVQACHGQRTRACTAGRGVFCAACASAGAGVTGRRSAFGRCGRAWGQRRGRGGGAALLDRM